MPNKKNAPAGSTLGPGESESVINTISTPDYIKPPALSQVDTLSLYESQMAEADATGDPDLWIDAYQRWLDLHYQLYVSGVT